MTEPRINITFAVTQLCMALNLEPKNVAELIVTPTDVFATVLESNENGSPHVDANGDVVKRNEHFKVTTG